MNLSAEKVTVLKQIYNLVLGHLFEKLAKGNR